MANPAFAFVQGSERLDWRVLVSIDVERLMKSTNVETLQRIVENIAFSHVTRDEAALFTPDHTLHLFQLCQLVIQYLVYSQDILAKINMRLNDRMEGQQDTMHRQEALVQRLTDEMSLLKKQVKTQRRTLLAYEYNAQAALAHGLTSRGAAATASTPAPLYICPYCGEEYHKAESMQSHLRKRHSAAGAQASFPAADTAALPSRAIAGGGGSTYCDGPASPMPPATGAPTVLPVAAVGPTAAAEVTGTLQQLRHRVDQLEKDKEAMERQQRENLMLMLLSATRSQTVSPPPPQQVASPPPPQQQPPQTVSPPPPQQVASPPPPQQQPPQTVSPPPPQQVASPPPPQTVSPPSATGAPPLVSPPLPPSVSKTETAGDDVPAHLRGVPVVPDVSAMMSYNLSCQREASENALRRQLVNLEAEIRALRTSKSTAASIGLREASPPRPTSAATASWSPAAPPSAPSLDVPASCDGPAVVRPAWVAELENGQQRQQQHRQSSGSPAVSSLAPTSTPPPAPLPPPPPQQQHGYLNRVTVPSLVSPPSLSQTSSTQSQLTSAVASPGSATPSLSVPSPLQSSSPAPQPSYAMEQQQQPSPAAPPPAPSVLRPPTAAAAIPMPSPATAATTEGGAPAAPTPTPSVTPPPLPEVHRKPNYLTASSTDSSLTSTSTVPPHRAISKGPPGAPIFLTSDAATPPPASATPEVLGSATPATATMAFTSAAPAPLPSAASAGSLAIPVPSPGLSVGSYFSPRTSVSAAATPVPTPLPMTPPPATPQYSYTAQPSTPSPSVSNTYPSPKPPVPVMASGTGGNSTSVSGWSPPAPVSTAASVPVPGAVRPFRQFSSSGSSSSSSGSRYSIGS
ncbi:hypothetical protein CUR178_04735 [Leishmania enriettii]|uniref:C2H2-type domain-containing protein n=1 Tax=Leishmania enriettii TaxID=5663 RepID=A0A836HS25_LEIEN|nr:hypothetical protein CUR178_04735 [Leishmania enriettii]